MEQTQTQEASGTCAKPFKLFALEASKELGASIAARLGARLAAHEERDFEDGEHKARPLEPVAGADVYVIHSLHGDPIQSPNDKLCRLLFFIGALKDAGANRVTGVVPYLCYARKDRRTKSLDPVTTRYVEHVRGCRNRRDRYFGSPQPRGFRECFSLPDHCADRGPNFRRAPQAAYAWRSLCRLS